MPDFHVFRKREGQSKNDISRQGCNRGTMGEFSSNLTINFQTINFQTMYRVIFYKKKTDFRGNIYMDRISLDSGCTTLAEAFSFAVENGADPNKNILYKWIEQ